MCLLTGAWVRAWRKEFAEVCEDMAVLEKNHEEDGADSAEGEDVGDEHYPVGCNLTLLSCMHAEMRQFCLILRPYGL